MMSSPLGREMTFFMVMVAQLMLLYSVVTAVTMQLSGLQRVPMSWVLKLRTVLRGGMARIHLEISRFFVLLMVTYY